MSDLFEAAENIRLAQIRKLEAERDQLFGQTEQLKAEVEAGRRQIDTLTEWYANALNEIETLRKDADRASYWKQRAKSAEGHLYSSDFNAAAMALHKQTSFGAVAWDELSGVQQAQIHNAVGVVIGVVNDRRDARRPHDAALSKGKGEQS